MKTSYVVGIVIVLILIAGGVYAWTQNKASGTTPAAMSSTTMPADMDMSNSNTPTVQTSITVGATPIAASAASPAAMHFTVNGNDATADLKTITVKKGTPVTITFGADSGTTYHGGLDFRSATVSTGTITPGSTKDLSFTATSNMTFTPYWPSTNIAKPYTINVVVN